MKIFCRKYRINLLSWVLAVPSPARCIYHRGRSSRSLALPLSQTPTAYKTWNYKWRQSCLLSTQLLPIFQVQLRSFGLHRLQLDSHVLIVVQVLPQSQLSKVTTADLLPDPECLGNETSEGCGTAPALTWSWARPWGRRRRCPPPCSSCWLCSCCWSGTLCNTMSL